MQVTAATMSAILLTNATDSTLPSDNENDSKKIHQVKMDNQRDNSPVQLAVQRDGDVISPLVPYTVGTVPQQDENKTFPTEPQPDGGTGQDIKPFRCYINADRLNQLRKKVEDAIREHKTFTVKGGFQYIRNALLSRGWVERIEFKTQFKNICISNPPSMDEVCCNLPPKQDWETSAAHLAKCEKMIISRLLQYHEVDFYWNMRRDSNEWQQRLNKNKIINRFSRSLFTSKEGLCLLLQQMYWHTEPGVAFVRFPRCYTINFADQCTAFIEDFRLTSCISLLKWFTQKMHNDGEYSICSNDGKVPMTALQFALDRCNEYIAVQKHVDLDREFHKVWDHEWEHFLTHFQLIVHIKEKFEENSGYSLFAFETSAKSTLKNIVQFWPQYQLDGWKNVWIMKPGNKCRGRDITLIKDVGDVIKVMNHKLKYVVQKYIERPLLIYKTKFDIRQWFILTCVQPLTIWMYRDCYLRFSSKKFTLDDFHESVHLTNHAVQHKYSNQDRDKSLPDDNMWDNHTFKAYLRQIGQAEKWYKVVYPGMKECIIGAMLASQDTMDRRPNTFELYGADFMIAENFTPWLLEINSCPAMGPTTSVTARMCPQCFEDMVKVVVDRRRDPKSETGLFEMVYKQTLPQTPAYLGMTLSVRGRKIFKKKSANKQTNKIPKEPHVQNKHHQKCKPLIKTQAEIEMIKNYNGPVIGNLIEELHNTLFESPAENLTELPIPPAPQVSLVDIREPHIIHRRPHVVSKVTLNRKARSSNLTFSNRNSSEPSDDSRMSRKQLKKRKPITAQQVTSSPHSHSIRIINNKRKSFEKPVQFEKSAKTLQVRNWESNTASILNINKTDFLKNFKQSTASLLPNLQNLDAKNLTASDICRNLLTVGLGYNKSLIKENLILPMGSQPTNVVNNGCCLKL